MITCLRYNTVHKSTWDDFVDDSKTPLFFFKRDYMEYHSDRFTDHSLLFYKDQQLIAIFPANQHKTELHSHGGLTYGGLLFQSKARSDLTMAVMAQLLATAKQSYFNKIIFKSIPYIFYNQAAQDELYALFYHAKAKLFRRDLSSVIRLDRHIGFSKGRKCLIARAKKNNLCTSISKDWTAFHALLCCVLSKHGANPVHSSNELAFLQNKFPKNITLNVVMHKEQMIAALVLFIFNNVVHTQYMAVSEEGKALGALDYLIAECIKYYKNIGLEYLSFGASTEQNGHIINEGLIAQKESFGARSIVLDFYEICI